MRIHERSGRVLFGVFLLVAACGRGASPADAPASAPAASLMAAPDQYFERGDVRLRYRDFGTGEPVVLLHGFTQRIELMQDLADSLTGPFRIIVPDSRGHGLSSKSGEVSRYGPTLTDDVIGLIDHLGLDRVHLIGHSMGAVVAANAALRFPARVKTVTLVAGPFFPDSAAADTLATPYVRDLAEGKGLKRFVLWLFPGIPDSIATGFSDQAVSANDVPSLVAALDGMDRLMVRADQVPANQATVLIVGAEHDPLLQYSQALKAKWPQAELVVISGADHNSVRASGATIAAIRRRLATP